MNIGAGILSALLVAFAAKALKIIPDLMRKSPWAVGLAIGAFIAFFAPEEQGWFPIAMGVGGIVHILNDIYRHLELVEYAVEAVHEMEAEGIEVMFCSSPYITHLICASEKLESIGEHFGSRWAPRTILANDKTFVHGDILIDDHPAIKGSHTPTWKHLVFDRPYNRHLDLPRLHQWQNWREAVYPMLEKSFALR